MHSNYSTKKNSCQLALNIECNYVFEMDFVQGRQSFTVDRASNNAVFVMDTSYYNSYK